MLHHQHSLPPGPPGDAKAHLQAHLEQLEQLERGFAALNVNNGVRFLRYALQRRRTAKANLRRAVRLYRLTGREDHRLAVESHRANLERIDNDIREMREELASNHRVARPAAVRMSLPPVRRPRARARRPRRASSTKTTTTASADPGDGPQPGPDTPPSPLPTEVVAAFPEPRHPAPVLPRGGAR